MTGTARWKRGGGVKIKDGEKVREETSQSPMPRAPENVAKCLRGHCSNRVAGPSTLGSRQEAGGRFQPQEAGSRVKLCPHQGGRASTGGTARQPGPVRPVGTWVPGGVGEGPRKEGLSSGARGGGGHRSVYSLVCWLSWTFWYVLVCVFFHKGRDF